MKRVVLFLLATILFLNVDAQRIRDLTNQSKYDSNAYFVIDKAGWVSYKKLKADLVISSVAGGVQNGIDSLKVLVGFAPASYVPYDTSTFLRTADFTRYSFL